MHMVSHRLTQFQAVATEAGLLNRYGAPNTQAFASYGYCAAMHIDNDDSVTMGWISSRSDQVSLNENVMTSLI